MATPVLAEGNTHGAEQLSTSRPKVLFIAYYFPPLNSSGCVRTWNIAKYLSRLGWEVTVVTPDPALWRNAEGIEMVSAKLDSEGIKRILTGHQWRCLVPGLLKCWNQSIGWFAGGVCRTFARNIGIEAPVGWIKAADQICSCLSPKNVDVILVSGSPFVAFRLAKQLSDRLRRPYILDYRDLWTGNAHNVRKPWSATIREEANLLRCSSAVTIVSPSWGAALDRDFGVGKKLHVISNGYDPEEMAIIKPYDFGHCAFVYTGIFISPKRIISPFLAALRLLQERPDGGCKRWYFHYYGAHEKHVREEAARFGLNERIVLHGRVSQQEAVAAVKGASLAIVIAGIEEQNTLEDRGIVTGKIFEAIGVATPVLLIAPEGSDATTTTGITGLVNSFSGTNIEGMASFLRNIIEGQVPQPQNVNVFSWANIIKDFDVVLRRAMASPV